MKQKSFQSESAAYLSLTNSCGLEVVLSDCGASIYQIKLRGVPMNIAPDTPEAFEASDAFYGKCLGRIAGRVKGGVVEINGQTYQMSLTEGNNASHGGKKTFAYQRFKMPPVEEKEDSTRVYFLLDSPNGEENLPGNLHFVVIYELMEKEPILRVRFLAETDQDTALAPIIHPYFNLGEEDVLSQRLKVNASSYYSMDEEQIPLQEERVTPLLDFRNGKTLGEGAEDPSFQNAPPWGYDHLLVLSHKEDEPDAVLENEKYRLEVRTDMPCLLIYADNFAHGIALYNGYAEKKHAALAIECSEHPFAIRPNILHQGETYQRMSEFRFLEQGKTK